MAIATPTAEPSTRPRRQPRRSRSGNGKGRAPRARQQHNGHQERIMAYAVAVVGQGEAAVAHVYEKKAPGVTRCGLALDRDNGAAREGSFYDYSQTECPACCEAFGVARLWQVYPPMEMGAHQWDARGRRIAPQQ